MTKERIAKYIANCGICSRREAEKLIRNGLVSVDDQVIDSPALNISDANKIKVRGKLISKPKTRLFLFHKPRGVVTTHKDPQNRKTLFELLPKNLPRLISIGRLDYNTEGLILLTNNGDLARRLELPENNFVRSYKVRAYGVLDRRKFAKLGNGVAIEGINYKPMQATIEQKKNLPHNIAQNFWLRFEITEGKNREIRKICEYMGLEVSRLIRTGYADFKLGNLAESGILEVGEEELCRLLAGSTEAEK